MNYNSFYYPKSLFFFFFLPQRLAWLHITLHVFQWWVPVRHVFCSHFESASGEKKRMHTDASFLFQQTWLLFLRVNSIFDIVWSIKVKWIGYNKQTNKEKVFLKKEAYFLPERTSFHYLFYATCVCFDFYVDKKNLIFFLPFKAKSILRFANIMNWLHM